MIEILVAVVIVAVSVSALSLLFPKATQSVSANRQRLEASGIAEQTLSQIERVPYGVIGLTPALNASNATNFPIPGIGPCDCNANVGTIDSMTPPIVDGNPVNGSQAANETSFIVSLCINQVQGTSPNAHWVSFCPVTSDTGLKNVRVRVSWTGTSNVKNVFDLDTVVARS